MTVTVGTAQEAFDAFILSRELMGCTGKTVRLYREVQRDFLGTDPGWPLTFLDAQRYVGAMRSRNLKPSTIKTRLGTVQAFGEWAHRAGLLPDNPAKAIKLRRVQTLPNVPTPDEVSRMLRATDASWEGMRARTMLLVLIDTGLRVSELTRLRWEDMDATTQYLAVRQGKGQKDRVVPYGLTVAQALNRWMNRQGVVRPEDFIFSTRTGRWMTAGRAYAVIQGLGRRAKLARSVSPHKFRHFFATQYLRNGGDLETLRQILGHATLMMVLRYARLISKDVGRVHRRASPADQLDR